MADAKISALTELAATPATDDYLPIIDASEVSDASKNKRITVGNLFGYNSQPEFVPLTTPLTSTAWDGDSFSTTDKTLIDLSAVFNAPAGIKAVDVLVNLRDSESATTYSYMYLSPNNLANSGKIFSCDNGKNDGLVPVSATIPCNSDGDIYYQIIASGSGTMDVTIQIWGYWL